MLAMSTNLAAPGVSVAYRKIAKYLHWSLVGMKGNTPLLDDVFNNTQDVEIPGSSEIDLNTAFKSIQTTSLSSAPRTPPRTSSSLNPHPSLPQEPPPPPPPIHQPPLTQPPSIHQPPPDIPPGTPQPTTPPERPPESPSLRHRSRGRALTEAPTPGPSPLTRAGRQPPQPALASVSPLLQRLHPPPPPRAPPDGLAASRDPLLTWLRTVFNSSGGNSTTNASSANLYVIGGAAAGSTRDILVVDAGRGQLLDDMPGTQFSGFGGAVGAKGGNATAGKPKLVTDAQNLPYTLAVAGILMVALIVGHLILVYLYRRFVHRDVHPLLRFPRAEMSLGGLLLVAVTFYSSLALSGSTGPLRGNRITATVVLALVVLPYLIVLWWLTLCRCYLEEKPRDWNPDEHWKVCTVALESGEHKEDGDPVSVEEDARLSGGSNRSADLDVIMGPHWALPPTFSISAEAEPATVDGTPDATLHGRSGPTSSLQIGSGSLKMSSGSLQAGGDSIKIGSSSLLLSKRPRSDTSLWSGSSQQQSSRELEPVHGSSSLGKAIKDRLDTEGEATVASRKRPTRIGLGHDGGDGEAAAGRTMNALLIAAQAAGRSFMRTSIAINRDRPNGEGAGDTAEVGSGGAYQAALPRPSSGPQQRARRRMGPSMINALSSAGASAEEQQQFGRLSQPVSAGSSREIVPNGAKEEQAETDPGGVSDRRRVSALSRPMGPPQNDSQTANEIIQPSELGDGASPGSGPGEEGQPSTRAQTRGVKQGSSGNFEPMRNVEVDAGQVKPWIVPSVATQNRNRVATMRMSTIDALASAATRLGLRRSQQVDDERGPAHDEAGKPIKSQGSVEGPLVKAVRKTLLFGEDAMYGETLGQQGQAAEAAGGGLVGGMAPPPRRHMTQQAVASASTPFSSGFAQAPVLEQQAAEQQDEENLPRKKRTTWVPRDGQPINDSTVPSTAVRPRAMTLARPADVSDAARRAQVTSAGRPSTSSAALRPVSASIMRNDSPSSMSAGGDRGRSGRSSSASLFRGPTQQTGQRMSRWWLNKSQDNINASAEKGQPSQQAPADHLFTNAEVRRRPVAEDTQTYQPLPLLPSLPEEEDPMPVTPRRDAMLDPQQLSVADDVKTVRVKPTTSGPSKEDPKRNRVVVTVISALNSLMSAASHTSDRLGGTSSGDKASSGEVAGMPRRQRAPQPPEPGEALEVQQVQGTQPDPTQHPAGTSSPFLKSLAQLPVMQDDQAVQPRDKRSTGLSGAGVSSSSSVALSPNVMPRESVPMKPDVSGSLRRFRFSSKRSGSIGSRKSGSQNLNASTSVGQERSQLGQDSTQLANTRASLAAGPRMPATSSVVARPTVSLNSQGSVLASAPSVAESAAGAGDGDTDPGPPLPRDASSVLLGNMKQQRQPPLQTPLLPDQPPQSSPTKLKPPPPAQQTQQQQSVLMTPGSFQNQMPRSPAVSGQQEMPSAERTSSGGGNINNIGSASTSLSHALKRSLSNPKPAPDGGGPSGDADLRFQSSGGGGSDGNTLGTSSPISSPRATAAATSSRQLAWGGQVGDRQAAAAAVVARPSSAAASRAIGDQRRVGGRASPQPSIEATATPASAVSWAARRQAKAARDDGDGDNMPLRSSGRSRKSRSPGAAGPLGEAVDDLGCGAAGSADTDPSRIRAEPPQGGMNIGSSWGGVGGLGVHGNLHDWALELPLDRIQQEAARWLCRMQQQATAGPVGEGVELAEYRFQSDSMATAAPKGVDAQQLALYPGKHMPLYRLQYQPGCWMLRWRILPPIHILARFEFMFEDATGEGETQLGRENELVLAVTAVNITHKVMCAALLGALGLRASSPLQLGLLAGLQGGMVAYLAAVKPYVEWQLQMVEVVCHAAMLLLICCAVALLDSKPNNKAPTTYIMLGCFFLIVLMVMLYGVRHMCLVIVTCWKAWRGHRWLAKEKHKRKSLYALEAMEDGRVTKTANATTNMPGNRISNVSNAAAASAGGSGHRRSSGHGNSPAFASLLPSAHGSGTTASLVPSRQLEVIPELQEVDSFKVEGNTAELKASGGADEAAASGVARVGAAAAATHDRRSFGWKQ
ncbi:hypothetical protein PLESTB_000107700 [Pleodorina starrii]|uniref:Uncharacterized protein n=1 Tax=Pleodorina starrii TaxID=330485 RepID=A0A9W6BAG9_9CHLO|nr:hypothetical protein PLESTB_000107700 [Pleodorina starrii]